MHDQLTENVLFSSKAIRTSKSEIGLIHYIEKISISLFYIFCILSQTTTGVNWRSGRASDSGSTGCEFEFHHCFNLLTALGKLLTTNVHPLDPGVNGYLAKDSYHSVAPGIIAMAAMGVYTPQGAEMVLECIMSVIKARG